MYQLLNLKPAPHLTSSGCSHSDRYEPGMKPVLIWNAAIWTGLQNGLDVVRGDILLEQGLIKAIGNIDTLVNKGDIAEVDTKGKWDVAIDQMLH
ncbi:hypothetical protein BU15DRAFT_84184 [Melanogaster broomeanus]|nr:hypothetical protein BU15DRAFT_84184 [Melanogaster broomeanus]